MEKPKKSPGGNPGGSGALSLEIARSCQSAHQVHPGSVQRRPPRGPSRGHILIRAPPGPSHPVPENEVGLAITRLTYSAVQSGFAYTTESRHAGSPRFPPGDPTHRRQLRRPKRAAPELRGAVGGRLEVSSRRWPCRDVGRITTHLGRHQFDWRLSRLLPITVTFLHHGPWSVS